MFDKKMLEPSLWVKRPWFLLFTYWTYILFWNGMWSGSIIWYVAVKHDNPWYLPLLLVPVFASQITYDPDQWLRIITGPKKDNG